MWLWMKACSWIIIKKWKTKAEKKWREWLEHPMTQEKNRILDRMADLRKNE